MQEKKKNSLRAKSWIVIILVLMGSSYGIYTGIRDLLQSQKKRERWAEGDRRILIDRCVLDAKDMAVKYPELTQTYCACSTDHIQANFTRAAYENIVQQSIPEQTKILLPFFQDCLTEYKNQIRDRETTK